MTKKAGLSTKVQRISPAIAEKVLEGDRVRNRKTDWRIIEKYARDMERGAWELGPPLLFNGQSGESWSGLIDGQHRLAAVVKSGVATDFVVMRGVDPSAFSIVDTGKPRSVSDLLTMMGVKNAALVASIARILVCSERSESEYPGGPPRVQPSPRDVAERGYDDVDIQDIAVLLAGSYKKMARLFGAAAVIGWFIYSLKDFELEDMVKDFCETVMGEQIASGTRDPAHVLKKKLEDNLLAKRKMSKKEKTALLIKAWNAWALGREIGVLRFATFGRGREEFPELITTLDEA